MPSRADTPFGRRWRQLAERLLRALLIVSLLLAIRHAFFAMSERPSRSASGGEGRLRAALIDWSTASNPALARLSFDSVPSAATRDWAKDLRGAGTPLSWTSTLPTTAVSVEPIPDPKGTSRIFVAAPPKSTVAIFDSLGPMDSVSVRAVGAAVGPVVTHGIVRAAVAGATASAAALDSLSPGAVLVLGRAGWEAKFIVASLEEYGWRVSARLNVSPGNDVTLGAPANDISIPFYSAVVVLDSSAARFAPAIIRYVRSGGGLITVGEGGSVGALAPLLPAAQAEVVPAGAPDSLHPRNALAMRPLVNLKPDAVALEKRGARVAIAARRSGTGRVIQVGYDDTWRWRMAGAGDAVEDYRSWISSVVSSGAYAPRFPRTPALADPAPVAALHAALGPPAAAGTLSGNPGSEDLLLDLFIVAVASLLLETASRRLDGKP